MENPPNVIRIINNRASKSDKVDDKEKANPSHRNARYKEKYQALRERYGKVTATNAGYRHDLEMANAKLKKLEEENELLLDAIQAHSSSPTTANSNHPHSPPSAHVVPSQGYGQGPNHRKPPQQSFPHSHSQYPPTSEPHDYIPANHGHGYPYPTRQHQHIPHGYGGGTRTGGNYPTGEADPLMRPRGISVDHNHQTDVEHPPYEGYHHRLP